MMFVSTEWRSNDKTGQSNIRGEKMSNIETSHHVKMIFQAEEGSLSGGYISTSLSGFSGKGYVTGLLNEGDSLEVKADIPNDGQYKLLIRLASMEGEKRNFLYIDGDCYGQFISEKTDSFEELEICTLFFTKGLHTIKIVKDWGGVDIDRFMITSTTPTNHYTPTFQLVNKDSSAGAKKLMNFFREIYGQKIITGQHTAAAHGPELDHIKKVTGKLPALRGFDLLSYSFMTDTDEPTDHKLIEIEENKGSIESAIEWSTRFNGIVTFCWHWYAPTGGKDKTFYTENTQFDLNKALIPGTTEYEALLSDMDEIALQLKKLKDANVPVLWRPLHEADGGWFWWGASGPETYKSLYKWMFERFTKEHQLNNLIWVWNAPNKEWYPGDDYVDIAGVDTYVPNGEYGPLKCQFDHLQALINNQKPIALTENGPIPDPEKLIKSRTPWLWYMPWYGDFVFNGLSTSEEQLKKVYDHPYCLTLEDLQSVSLKES
ncbi:hypothetical protein CHH83_03955 [Bacillus sp. 7586-K]|nr:hypothetical protein CHH83_03955 [Bacillus sp. 7586-K]